jgi:hypothetical protein
MINLSEYSNTNKIIKANVQEDTSLHIYQHKKSGKFFFVKRIEINDYKYSRKQRHAQIQKEIFLLTKLSEHPHFISYHGAYINKYATKTGYERIEFLLFMDLASSSLDK